MNKKKLKGLKFIGIINLLVGILGILLIIMGLKMMLFPRFDPAKGYEFDKEIGKIMLIFGLVMSFFLLLGIYTLKYRKIAVILNIITSPVTAIIISSPFIMIFGSNSAYIFIPIGIVSIISYLVKSLKLLKS